jgi:hypothetical protein
MRILVLLALLPSGCGNSIGDSCNQSTDCSSDGDRQCDTASPGGYCTQEGCDFGTCPEEAVCVRFYPVTQLTAMSCEPGADPSPCALDEICVIGGYCAPRSTERRFCMKKCGGAGDCRDEYECRDEERMALHGGDPVPDPERPQTGGELQRYCAPALPCRSDTDCHLGDRCNLSRARCDQP